MHYDNEGRQIFLEMKSNDGACSLIVRDHRKLEKDADPDLRCTVAEIVYHSEEPTRRRIRKFIRRFKDDIRDFNNAIVASLSNELNLMFFSSVCRDPVLRMHFDKVRPDFISPKVKHWGYVLEFFRRVSSELCRHERQYPYFMGAACKAKDVLRVEVGGETLNVRREQTYTRLDMEGGNCLSTVLLKCRFTRGINLSQSITLTEMYSPEELPRIKEFVADPRINAILTTWLGADREYISRSLFSSTTEEHDAGILDWENSNTKD